MKKLLPRKRAGLRKPGFVAVSQEAAPLSFLIPWGEEIEKLGVAPWKTLSFS
jgi:hypothetical protein